MENILTFIQPYLWNWGERIDSRRSESGDGRVAKLRDEKNSFAFVSQCRNIRRAKQQHIGSASVKTENNTVLKKCKGPC